MFNLSEMWIVLNIENILNDRPWHELEQKFEISDQSSLKLSLLTTDERNPVFDYKIYCKKRPNSMLTSEQPSFLSINYSRNSPGNFLVRFWLKISWLNHVWGCHKGSLMLLSYCAPQGAHDLAVVLKKWTQSSILVLGSEAARLLYHCWNFGCDWDSVVWLMVLWQRNRDSQLPLTQQGLASQEDKKMQQRTTWWISKLRN